MFKYPRSCDNQRNCHQANQGQPWAGVKHYTDDNNDAQQIGHDGNDPFGKYSLDRFHVIDRARGQIADRSFIKIRQAEIRDLVKNAYP